MIPDVVRAEILRRLTKAEADHGVRILLAVESGSRAWGFASPNSDYDVRFIYAHAENWYLSVVLEDQRDVIEYPIVDDIDLNGWDLKKALRLFHRSNPGFVEWIQSPIVYLERTAFASKARELLPAVYSVERGIRHYRSMAQTNFRGALQEELVPLKKYFYVLRPLLAIRWLESRRSAPPLEFERLLTMLDESPDLVREVQHLLALKRAAPELGRAPKVAALNEFIEAELHRVEPLVLQPQAAAPIDVLNGLFRSIIRA